MNDEEMYVRAKDRWPRVLTSTINEDLGCIEYIFSDKTGTLTCNVMSFKMSIIGFTLYGDKKPQGKANLKVLNKNIAKSVRLTEFTFQDDELEELLLEENPDPKINTDLGLTVKSIDNKKSVTYKNQRELAFEYWTLLSTAHECTVIKKKGVEVADLDLVYGGPSPDEITLVDAAKYMGFIYKGCGAGEIDMKILEKNQTMKLCRLFEFDSNRKRMSVIV